MNRESFVFVVPSSQWPKPAIQMMMDFALMSQVATMYVCSMTGQFAIGSPPLLRFGISKSPTSSFTAHDFLEATAVGISRNPGLESDGSVELGKLRVK